MGDKPIEDISKKLEADLYSQSNSSTCSEMSELEFYKIMAETRARESDRGVQEMAIATCH